MSSSTSFDDDDNDDIDEIEEEENLGKCWVALVRCGKCLQTSLSFNQLMQILREECNGNLNNFETEPCWMHLVGPSLNDLIALSSVIPINSITTRDISMPSKEQKDRIELFDHYLYIATHQLVRERIIEASELSSMAIHIILFPKLIITIQDHHTPQIPFFLNAQNIEQKIGMPVTQNVWKILKKLQEQNFDFQSVDSIAFALFSCGLSDYQRVVLDTQSELDAIDELVMALSSSTNDSISLLHRIRRVYSRINFIFWRLQDKQDMLTNFHRLSQTYGNIGGTKLLLSIPTRFYMRHIIAGISNVILKAQIQREFIENIQDAYLNIMSLESAQSDNSTNQVIKKLNAVATTMLPLTGMNVGVPGGYDSAPNSEHNWFYIIFGLFFIFFIVSMSYMYYVKYL